MTQDLTEKLKRDIPLAEMIQTLRIELAAAMEEGKDAPLRFGLEHVDLELQVRIEKEHGVSGKATFWVVGADAAHSRSDEAVHTFRLRLTPRITTEGSGLGGGEVFLERDD